MMAENSHRYGLTDLTIGTPDCETSHCVSTDEIEFDIQCRWLDTQENVRVPDSRESNRLPMLCLEMKVHRR
jgi:hypothetical protein